MATVQNNDDEEQGSSNQNQSGSSSPTPVASATPSTTGSSTGGSSAPSGGSKTSGGASAPAYNSSAPTSSGNFTNLKSYLGANNNGQDFSNQVNNNLQQQGSNLNTNIQGASNQFNNQVQSAVTPVQQNYQAYQNVAANNDPNAIANYASQGNNAQNIQGLESATYTGPKTLNDLSGNNNGAALQSQVNNYQNLANDTSSDAGRANLLQSLYGNSNYNQGQQTLDNVFLQGNNFGKTVSNANNLNNSFNQANNNATTSAQNASNTINQAATGTINSLNGAVANQGQNFQNDYNNALSAQNSAYTTDQSALQSGTISQALANQLGINSGMNIYNIDPSQYLQKATDLTAQNTGTAQDYANVTALQNLLGNNATTGSSQLLSQYSNQPQKLLTSADYLNYDSAGLTGATTAAGQAYQQAIGSDVNNVNNNLLFGTGFQQGQSGANVQNGVEGTSSIPLIQNSGTLSGATLAQLGGGIPQQITQNSTLGAGSTNALITGPNAAQVGDNQLYNYLQQNGASSSPLQYYQNLINSEGGGGSQQFNNYLSQIGGANSAQAGAIQSLANIIQQNNIYDPTKQLQITPNAPVSS